MLVFQAHYQGRIITGERREVGRWDSLKSGKNLVIYDEGKQSTPRLSFRDGFSIHVSWQNHEMCVPATSRPCYAIQASARKFSGEEIFLGEGLSAEKATAGA